MKSTNTLLILGCVAALLAGPALGAPSGDPGRVAPRLVTTDNGGVWDNTSTFGAVSPAHRARGASMCRAAGFARATGFHPVAQDVNGVTHRAGGYLCVD